MGLEPPQRRTAAFSVVCATDWFWGFGFLASSFDGKSYLDSFAEHTFTNEQCEAFLYLLVTGTDCSCWKSLLAR